MIEIKLTDDEFETRSLLEKIRIEKESSVEKEQVELKQIAKKIEQALETIGKIKVDDDGYKVFSEYAKGYIDGFNNGAKVACCLNRSSSYDVDEQEWLG